MRKKVNSVFAAMVFVVLSAFLVVEGAEAFCIYNYTDTTIAVSQSEGADDFFLSRGYSGFIAPGNKGCCNWQEHSCNKAGTMNSIVKFDVSYAVVPIVAELYICIGFPITAGGELLVTGNGGSYRCLRND